MLLLLLLLLVLQGAKPLKDNRVDLSGYKVERGGTSGLESRIIRLVPIVVKVRERGWHNPSTQTRAHCIAFQEL